MMLLARFGIDLLAVMASWGLFALLFIGVGLAARFRVAGKEDAPSPGDSFWVGWAAVIALLQVWHLLLPVDGRAFVFIALISAAGLWRHRAAWRDWRAGLKGIERARWLLVALALVWMAHHALGGPTIYDTGYYHAQTVKWIRSFPIVPGLANLHDRFGFNNSSFLYAALLDVGPWAGRYYHFANGLLLAVLAVQLILDLPPRGDQRPRVAHFFSSLMLIAVAVAARGKGVTSPTPDMPVFLLGIVVSRMLLEMLGGDERAAGGRSRTVLLLCLVGVTVKLSFLAFALAASGVALGVSAFRKRGALKMELLRAALLGLLVLGPWAGRGIILSGYPAYPITLGGAPVEWKAPKKIAETQIFFIKRWARYYSFAPGDYDYARWPSVWLRGCLRDADVGLPLAILALAGLLAAVLRPWRNGPKRPKSRWWLFLPPAAWLIYWGFTAPAPRFAGAAFWIIGGGAAAFLLDAAWPEGGGPSLRRRIGLKRAGIIGMILLALYGLVGGKREFVKTLRESGSPVKAFERLRVNVEFLNGHAFYSRFQPMPVAPLKTFVTDSGLTLFVPVSGERCWDAPLPCTPIPRRGLRLRGRTLRQGFVVDWGDEL